VVRDEHKTMNFRECVRRARSGVVRAAFGKIGVPPYPSTRCVTAPVTACRVPSCDCDRDVRGDSPEAPGR
jgi:hypothetical protein